MISILLPTRKRHKQLQRMVSSVKRASAEQPEVIVYVDDDDEESAKKANDLGIKVIVGPKLLFSDYYNKCYEQATGDILVMCGDDVIFRTIDWDEMVEEEFSKWPDKIIMLYGNDLLNISIQSHPIIHRRWAETVGYFSPPYFSYGGCDVWL